MPLALNKDTPCVALGIAGDEGMYAAYLPAMVGAPKEVVFRDGKREFLVFAYDGVVYDMLPADGKTVKWWLVRQAARENRLDIINPFWSGPADELRVTCLPDVPRPAGTALAIRQYNRGPWIILDPAEDDGPLVLEADE